MRKFLVAVLLGLLAVGMHTASAAADSHARRGVRPA